MHVDPANGVDGFVAVAEDTGRLYREFMFRDGLQAGLRAAPAVLRHPWKVVETLRYGVDGGADEARGRDPGDRGGGATRAAKESGERWLRPRRTSFDGAASNTPTSSRPRTTTPHSAPYFACGFQRHATVEVHRGVVQEVLVWP